MLFSVATVPLPLVYVPPLGKGKTQGVFSISKYKVSAFDSTSIDLTYTEAYNVGLSAITFKVNQNSYSSGYNFNARTDTKEMKSIQYNPGNSKIQIVYYNDTEIT